MLEASCGYEKIPPFCLIAHMDTAGEVTGENVNPNVIENYAGNPINLKCGVTLDSATDKALAIAANEHDTIITTDGTTLLGADDKAGIAEIITCLDFLAKNPQLKHGKIEVLFSPDEETGHEAGRQPQGAHALPQERPLDSHQGHGQGLHRRRSKDGAQQ